MGIMLYYLRTWWNLPLRIKQCPTNWVCLLVSSVSTSYELRIKHMVNPQQASSPLQHREPGAACNLTAPFFKWGGCGQAWTRRESNCLRSCRRSPKTAAGRTGEVKTGGPGGVLKWGMGLPVLTPFAGDSKFGVLIEGKGIWSCCNLGGGKMGAAGDIEVGGGGTSRKRVIQDSLRLTRCTRRVRQGYYAIDVRKRNEGTSPY